MQVRFDSSLTLLGVHLERYSMNLCFSCPRTATTRTRTSLVLVAEESGDCHELKPCCRTILENETFYSTSCLSLD